MAGIVVTVIFGVAVVLGIAIVTFLCCKDRKEQKRLVAKAEATALARAQTRKKKAEEVRAPLMRKTSGQRVGSPAAGGTGGDPFSDRNRS